MPSEREDAAAVCRAIGGHQMAAVLLNAMADEVRGVGFIATRTGLTERKVRRFFLGCIEGNPPRDALTTWTVCMAALGYVARITAEAVEKRSDPHAE